MEENLALYMGQLKGVPLRSLRPKKLDATNSSVGYINGLDYLKVAGVSSPQRLLNAILMNHSQQLEGTYKLFRMPNSQADDIFFDKKGIGYIDSVVEKEWEKIKDN